MTCMHCRTWLLWATLSVVLFLTNGFFAVGYSAIFLFINNSVHPDKLGTINGVVMTLTSITRWVFSHKYTFSSEMMSLWDPLNRYMYQNVSLVKCTYIVCFHMQGHSSHYLWYSILFEPVRQSHVNSLWITTWFFCSCLPAFYWSLGKWDICYGVCSMISPTVAVHVLIVVALQVQETLTNPNSLGSFLFRLVKVSD